MALRHLGFGEDACASAMANVSWPARMQRLKTGPLVDAAGRAELWLDGGHNPAAGRAIADLIKTLPSRSTHLICGMLNTKDIDGYLAPLAAVGQSLTAVDIPDEVNTLPAQTTADAAQRVGFQSEISPNTQSAIEKIIASEPNARILICGSLYLAGAILRSNG
jgi:dihydrofolate synthase/folylpolyglutamate synthase